MYYSTLSILSLFALCISANFAEETPVVKLPAKIEKIVRSAKSNILKEYQVEIAKLVKELEKSMIQATKAGNLKDANILDNLIKEVSSDRLLAEIINDNKIDGATDLLGNSKVDLAKSIIGVWNYVQEGETWQITFNKNGTISGKKPWEETTFKIINDIICIYTDRNTLWTKFEFSNGKLVNPKDISDCDWKRETLLLSTKK